MGWQIFGLDETGIEQLRQSHLAALAGADLIIADARFHEMLAGAGAACQPQDWPRPFSDFRALLKPYQAKKVAIFTTGDPLFYGAGVSLKRAFPDQEMQFLPALSGVTLASARLGWAGHVPEVVSIHGRQAISVIPKLYPFAKLLVIPRNAASSYEVAQILCARGLGKAEMTVLSALGRGDEEGYLCKSAEAFCKAESTGLPDFYILAIDLAPCGRFAFYSQKGALPDDAFESDGKLTKQDVRASALAKLQPHKGAVLWDLGTGCGSIAIEWARSEDLCHAHGVDCREDRLARARINAERLGTPNVTWHAGDICEVMAALPEPDAIFIGGGLSEASLTTALSYLPVGGRLVCHAVTLESEAILIDAHKRYGGALTRVAVNKAEAVGAYRGWRGLMPVTQWVFLRENDNG